jgi:hypothetical protein
MSLPEFYNSPGSYTPASTSISGQLHQIKTDTLLNSIVKKPLWTAFGSESSNRFPPRFAVTHDFESERMRSKAKSYSSNFFAIPLRLQLHFKKNLDNLPVIR